MLEFRNELQKICLDSSKVYLKLRKLLNSQIQILAFLNSDKFLYRNLSSSLHLRTYTIL